MAGAVNETSSVSKRKRSKVVSYQKYGYIFLIPFFLVYIIFNLVPLVSTFYYSFFENYFKNGLQEVGPNFIGLDNYTYLFRNGDLLKYAGNTIVMWLVGFIPQILISLLLAAWFTDSQLRLKGQGFFKTVIYLPNLIMASAFAMLFFALFGDEGPVNQILQNLGILKEPFRFLSSTAGTRGLVGGMNFVMWFGNTTILLMAGMMGIDEGLFEAARVDGAKPSQIFFKITLPLLKPIFVYVFITSMIGGLQMFDIPQVLTNGEGSPNKTATTLIMYLNKNLYSKNYGRAGALSVILFIITGFLSYVVYKSMAKKNA